MCRILRVLYILGKNKNIITIFINVFTIHANKDSYIYILYIIYSQRSMIITVSLYYSFNIYIYISRKRAVLVSRFIHKVLNTRWH